MSRYVVNVVRIWMYHSNWQAIRQHCGLHKNLLGMLSSKDNAWLTPAKLLPNIKIWKKIKFFYLNLKFADDWREHYVGVHFVNPIPIDFSNLSPSNHSFSSNRAFHIFSLEYEIETVKQGLKFHGCYFCSIFFLSWHWGKSQELCQSLAWWSVRAIFDRHIMVTKCYTFPAESHLEYLKTAATPPSLWTIMAQCPLFFGSYLFNCCVIIYIDRRAGQSKRLIGWKRRKGGKRRKRRIWLCN